MAVDLFDHLNDPDENVGGANNPENELVIKELSSLLNKGKGWRSIAQKVKES